MSLNVFLRWFARSAVDGCSYHSEPPPARLVRMSPLLAPRNVAVCFGDLPELSDNIPACFNETK